MKKLLLASSSSYIVEGACALFEKPRPKLKWCYIATAGKSVPDTNYLRIHQQKMKAARWDFEIFDLDGKNPANIKTALQNKDAIFMEGGNTFYLLKSIRESGFKEVLKEFLAAGGLYCGSSAGAYVCCPTIEQATWKKPERFDHHGVTDFTGMNLVPFIITAHCTPEIIAAVKPYADKTAYPVKYLTDQQAIIVRDNAIELVTDARIKPREH